VKRLDYNIPRNVNQAVDWLAYDLSYQDRSRLVNLDEKRAAPLYGYLYYTIRTVFYLDMNDPLLESCRHRAGREQISEEAACRLILAELKKKLAGSGAMRVVK
jgi:hypothetical protein